MSLPVQAAGNVTTAIGTDDESNTAAYKGYAKASELAVGTKTRRTSSSSINNSSRSSNGMTTANEAVFRSKVDRVQMEVLANAEEISKHEDNSKELNELKNEVIEL